MGMAMLVLAAAGLLLLFGARPSGIQAQAGAATQTATVSSRLQAALEVAAAADAANKVEIVAVLREQVDIQSAAAAAESAADGQSPDARVHARGQALYDALVATAQATQAPLRAWLDARGVTYRTYYLVNMLLIEGDAVLVEALRARPEIERLALNVATPALAITSQASSALPAQWHIGAVGAQSSTPPWGVTFVNAPAVWELGYTGEGIVVASQDTGVQWDHPALQSAYRGWDSTTMTVTHTYNWFDAWGLDAVRMTSCLGDAASDAQVPCDDNGHGTHTVGTMVGDATVDGGAVLGVAPDAEWIGCRNMSGGIGSPASYTDCFQFFLAPYPQGGDPMTDGDPSLAPHIINNSWSCPPSEGCDDPDILRSIVETALAAGQFVAASAGNSGSNGCSSISAPIAIYDASFTVGSIDSNGALSAFSSRGPVTADESGRIKPDIVAPGSTVYSAYPRNSYTWLNGTSMASPHVAGAVAVLWSAVPDLIGDIDRTEDILRASATPIAYTACGPDPLGDDLANNGYGAGQLNLLAAVQLALDTGPLLAVTVVDVDQQPVAESVVTAISLAPQQVYTATTGADGVALFTSIADASWQGLRRVTYLDDGNPPLVVYAAPVQLIFPMVSCGDEPCGSDAEALPFVTKPRN